MRRFSVLWRRSCGSRLRCGISMRRATKHVGNICRSCWPDGSDCAKPAKNGQAVHVRKQTDEPGSCMTRNEDPCLAQVHHFADRHNSITSCQLQRPDPKQDFFNTILDTADVRRVNHARGLISSCWVAARHKRGSRPQFFYCAICWRWYSFFFICRYSCRSSSCNWRGYCSVASNHFAKR
jgi:hypothetical protein